MAGTSSTGIVASLLGRHSVCVELEEKFCEWSRRNVERLEKSGKKLGEIKIVQGDARRLSEILGRADVAITSPPYANIDPTTFTNRHIGNREEPRSEYVKQEGYSDNPCNIGNLPLGNVDTVITSPPYAETYTGGGNPEKRRERLIKAGRNPKEFLGGKARNAVLKHYGEVDVCITSPPYSNAISKQGGPIGVKNVGVSTITARRYSDNPENIGNLPLGRIDTIVTSPPYSESMTKRRKGYTVIPELARTREMPQDTRDDNVANLPHGNIDAVITSPPYADGKKAGEVKPEEVEKYAKRWEENVEKRKWNSWGKSFHTPGRLKGIQSLRDGYSKSKENIGNLPLGEISTIITSPPYGEAQEGSGIAKRGYQGNKHSPTDLVGKRSYMPDKFQSPENISRLPLGNVDTVITSPPYEKSETIHKRQGQSPSYFEQVGGIRHFTKETVSDESNIGNLKKETYLEAMLKVYSEMFRVLKPNGLAIIVVKPFIRNKKVVDLPWHTWLLMAKAGFTLEKLYKLRLKTQSFWRILQYKKEPTLERIMHEYVIVARKPTAA
jgi:DNA modification methylase